MYAVLGYIKEICFLAVAGIDIPYVGCFVVKSVGSGLHFSKTILASFALAKDHKCFRKLWHINFIHVYCTRDVLAGETSSSTMRF